MSIRPNVYNNEYLHIESGGAGGEIKYIDDDDDNIYEATANNEWGCARVYRCVEQSSAEEM